jgi:ParB-like chromosome segregation protein Spo0J
LSGIIAELGELSVPVDSLEFYPGNARRGDLGLLQASLEAHGQYRPIVVNARTRQVLAGNHTLAAARALGWQEIAATFVDASEEQARRIALIDNRSNDLAGYDAQALADLLSSLPSLEATGYMDTELAALLAQLERPEPPGLGGLSERFGFPPFSVLDARAGAWQERKQAWLALGIESELGRRSDLLKLKGAAERKRRYFDDEVGRLDDASSAQRAYKGAVPHNREIQQRGFYDDPLAPPEEPAYAGTSVFDPVLCELAYRWFSPPAGKVLDPFAGGSVRGVVASQLGRAYLGVELSAPQIAANRKQARKIGGKPRPRWLEGDSRELEGLLGGQDFDLLFSCPPYFDLEVYSEDQRDLSRAASYEAFAEAHAAIIAAAAELLRPDRFAVWVVSEIRQRGGDGNCRGLLADTVSAFARAGLELYNEAVLVTPVGSLPIRAGRHFSAARKLGRTHQSVLVFVKGSGRKAAEACGELNMAELELGEGLDAA